MQATARVATAVSAACTPRRRLIRIVRRIAAFTAMKYVYGTPSADESTNLWKRFPGESDVTGDEYEVAANSLVKHLSNRYRLFSYSVDGDLYVRGDFVGDRTQYVELYLPELISADFISYFQSWLRAYEAGAWRIVIPTYVGDAATILIYPDVVRLGAEWESDLSHAYATIPQMMRAADEHGTFKKVA